MENLFTEFETATPQQWKDRIAKDLKGITFEQLQHKDDNELTVNPFYSQEDLNAATAPLFQHSDWEICERVKISDAIAANQQALKALNGGAAGLVFEFGNEDVDVATLLQEIQINYIYVSFEVQTIGQANAILAYYQAKNINIQEVNSIIVYDPIAKNVTTLLGNQDQEANWLQVINATKKFGISSAIYQNAGANSTTEIGLVAAHFNEYLYWLEKNNALSNVQAIQVKVAVGTQYFEEISKLRALQIVLKTITDQYQINPSVHIQSVTSSIYRSPFDSYTNLLRDTIASMAGVLGGSNSLVVLPYNDGFGAENDEFALRMARNQQIMLKEEAYLNQIADIANGSYFVETYTKELAQKAWMEFLAIEEQEGLLNAVASGSILNKIKEQSNALIAAYESGGKVLIGVNKYPNATDAPEKGKVSIANNQGISPINIAISLFN